MRAAAVTSCPEARADIVVIGGGPSGAAASRLLALWGHDVVLLSRPVNPRHALANSLPPSTHKVLAQVGLLDLVDRVGFRTTGNTVYWGGREGQVEPFSADGSAWGYQVDRARLDPLLLAAASAAGVRVPAVASVQQVDLGPEGARVSYRATDGPRVVQAPLVIDCSGRSGVLARPHRLRRHVPNGRMQALIGVWTGASPWPFADPTHTAIETCSEGWAWALPTSPTERHVGIMVDGATSRLTRGGGIESTYRAHLALTPRVVRQAAGCVLERVHACDASVYTAHRHAGSGFLLAGDAGSTLNPLSSFGVKKALASAWLAAVVANTCLRHPERTGPAQSLFAQWEAEVWHTSLARSQAFAEEAGARHASPFWAAQAAVANDRWLALDDGSLLTGADVQAALARLRDSDRVVFSPGRERTIVSAPVVRGAVVALEAAVRLGNDPREVRRYVRGIDLVELLALAPRHRDVAVLFERYRERHPASLPDFLGALSLLTARGALQAHVPVYGAHR